MRRCFWLLAVSACAHAPESAKTSEPAAPQRPQVWVDGSTSEGGDGTSARPLKTLKLAPGTVTHLATGLYELSGVLPDDVELVGDGKAVVLFGEGLEAGRARFRKLAIQGGQVGLTARGAVTLDQVSFSGQRQAAVRVEGSLTWRGGDVEGSVPESRGVVVTAGRADVSDVTFRGALRHGVTVEGGEAHVTGCTSDGAATAVHVSGGRAVVQKTKARRGRGPGFSAKGARLELKDVEAVAHEYGVLAGPGSELDVDGMTVERTQVGGVGLFGAKGVVRRLHATSPGSHGGISSLDSQTRAEDISIRGAVDLAVLARLGRLDAKKVRIEGVTGDGDGIMVRDAIAVLEDVKVFDIAGTGVVATAVSTVDLNGLRCEQCLHGALLVERRSTVKARGVVSISSREAAVTIPDDGVLELDGLDVTGNGPGVWAECAPGSRVVLKGKLPARELLSGRCLELPPPPGPSASPK